MFTVGYTELGGRKPLFRHVKRHQFEKRQQARQWIRNNRYGYWADEWFIIHPDGHKEKWIWNHG